MSKVKQLQPTIAEIQTGNYLFNSEMPIWNSSLKDMSWSYYDPTSPYRCGEEVDNLNFYRLMGIGEADKAQTYDYRLTREMVEDLKVCAIIHQFFPYAIKDSKKSIKTLKPVTTKSRIVEAAAILSSAIRIAEKKGSVIKKLSDIDFSLLKKAIEKHPGRGSHARRALKLITDPVVQRNYKHGTLSWNTNDLDSRKIRWPEDSTHVGIPTMPDELFTILSNAACNDIRKFKYSIGMKVHDTGSSISADNEAHQEYKDIKNAIYDWYEGTGDKYRVLLSKYSLTATEVQESIIDATCAAMCIILFYTGVRYSETLNIKKGCLDIVNGYWFIRSSVKKQTNEDLPYNRDLWLAIDIVRDAVEVLEYIADYVGTDYLFTKILKKGNTGKALTTTGIKSKLTKYLKRVDVNGKFKNWVLTSHQFRETLVAQLAKAQVGIPYISMQLKHFHSKFSIIPSDITAGYGQYRKSIMADVTSMVPMAREESLLELYGEDRHFAGGAAKKHTTKVESFFTGIGLSGEDRIDYIKQLSKSNISLIPTSIGGCTRNHNEACPNSDEEPRCYGDLQCDPDCGNHLIPESSAPSMLARREHALEQSTRPEQQHAKDIWLGLAEKLEPHLAKLGYKF